MNEIVSLMSWSCNDSYKFRDGGVADRAKGILKLLNMIRASRGTLSA